MTVAQAIAAGAHEDAARLLAWTLERDRGWIVAHADDDVESLQLAQYERRCARRRAGEPYAYIVGTAGFCGKTFLVNASVLIPRPETEHLVEEVIARHEGHAAVRILDVGTGSGAIGCTLAAQLPNARVDAVDVSPDALSVAMTNAKRLRVESRVAFHLGDLAAPVRGNRYDAIVANLPYVPTADIAPAPDPVSHEPRLALDGGPDGLDLYRRLLPELPEMLLPGGVLLMEAAPPVMEGLLALAHAAFPGAGVTVGRDYGDRARYVKVSTPG